MDVSEHRKIVPPIVLEPMPSASESTATLVTTGVARSADGEPKVPQATSSANYAPAGR
jgi:hypothetical protein